MQEVLSSRCHLLGKRNSMQTRSSSFSPDFSREGLVQAWSAVLYPDGFDGLKGFRTPTGVERAPVDEIVLINCAPRRERSKCTPVP